MQASPSSWIKDVSFKSDTLTVETKVGGSYSYQGVAGAVYNDMRRAKSLGKFHNENLRGKYTCVKG